MTYLSVVNTHVVVTMALSCCQQHEKYFASHQHRMLLSSLAAFCSYCWGAELP